MIPDISASPIFPFGPDAIWLGFVIVFALWSISAIILNYHWKTYGVDKKRATLMRSIFFVGSSFFLSVIFLSALTFFLS